MSRTPGAWGPLEDPAPRGELTAGPAAAAGQPALPVRRSRFLPAVIAKRVPPALVPAVDAVPGLARIAASTAYHTAGWGITASARTGARVARAMVDPHAANELGRDVNEAANAVAGLAKGLSAGLPFTQALAQLRVADVPAAPAPEPAAPTRREAEQRRLRAKAAKLLEASRDVWAPEAGHPAYERILGDLAPDEARILVLLLKDGPQPAVDVRTGGPVGMVNSHLVARGLNMIGPRAGLRYVELMPQYLNNLTRLGLVWHSSESLEALLRYQVVEAQPDVLEAMHSVRFPKVLRRSIHLTPFGVDFTRMCFVTEEEVAAEEFPTHLSPPIVAGESSLPRASE